MKTLAPFAEEPWAFALLSGEGGWSYVGRRPQAIAAAAADAAAVRALLRPTPRPEGWPAPFAGGVVGLAAFELGATLEPKAPQARTVWPDLVAARFDTFLAFDGPARRAYAFGAGSPDDPAAAASPAPGPLATIFEDREGAAAYARAVAGVVEAITRGDLFQANIARRWTGRLRDDARPFDVLQRLAGESAAPFAAYLRLPGRAVVSNSPERFLQVTAEGLAVTQPIKGTRPRGATPEEDARLGAELLVSPKDQAENRMIVDLMRNDLSRVCRPGSVEAPRLFALERYSAVQHLVSTVQGRLAKGRDALELFAAAFPPGSVSGAPKVQALREIARHEPPRGPYCGSLFWAGDDGAFESSVLIRTLAFEAEEGGGWRFEARAGAGITADSDPWAEAQEAEDKIAAIRRALLG